MRKNSEPSVKKTAGEIEREVRKVFPHHNEEGLIKMAWKAKVSKSHIKALRDYLGATAKSGEVSTLLRIEATEHTLSLFSFNDKKYHSTYQIPLETSEETVVFYTFASAFEESLKGVSAKTSIWLCLDTETCNVKLYLDEIGDKTAVAVLDIEHCWIKEEIPTLTPECSIGTLSQSQCLSVLTELEKSCAKKDALFETLNCVQFGYDERGKWRASSCKGSHLTLVNWSALFPPFQSMGGAFQISKIALSYIKVHLKLGAEATWDLYQQESQLIFSGKSQQFAVPCETIVEIPYGVIIPTLSNDFKGLNIGDCDRIMTEHYEQFKVAQIEAGQVNKSGKPKRDMKSLWFRIETSEKGAMFVPIPWVNHPFGMQGNVLRALLKGWKSKKVTCDYSQDGSMVCFKAADKEATIFHCLLLKAEK